MADIPHALIDTIAGAVRSIARQLFRDHPKEKFYYFSLITTGEGLAPTVSAWSVEALDAAAAQDSDPDKIRARKLLKWSYADSPYYGYGDASLHDVRRAFEVLPPPNPDDMRAFLAAVDLRMSAMVSAMERLDQEHIFGIGAARNGIVINVECMPPDHTNVQRATRLNPPQALKAWLAEAAEPE